MKDPQKLMEQFKTAKKQAASQKNPRILGTVTNNSDGWCEIEGDDDKNKYTANIEAEGCGSLKKDQKVSFRPIYDCGFLQCIAVEINIEGE